MRRLARAAAIGMATAAIGVALALTPVGLALEERFGLGWLFWLRGPIEVPDQVAVVGLDRESADRFGLPAKIREWPRTLHARAIERLAEAGATVIVLDLIFDEHREDDPVQDAALAEAIAGARRVVLLEYLDLANRPMLQGAEHPALVVTTERVIQPVRPLAEAAAGLAPFPLPKTSGRVAQFWLFRPTAGGSPTLPVMALQQHALAVSSRWPILLQEADVRALAISAGPELDGRPIDMQQQARSLRQAFQADPSLADRLRARLAAMDLEPQERRVLEALITAYAGPDSRYLNFYGPPGHVPNIPFHGLLAADPDELRDRVAGRAVFIGHSETANVQRDGFSTVYSRPDGIDLSGVEIAATAFANLLDGHLLEPAGALATVALLAGFGLAVGVLAGLLPALVAVPASLVLALAYFGGVQAAFSRAELWLPAAIPLLVQLPLGVFAGIVAQYRDAQQARRNLSQGIRYYLPERVAAGLAEAPLDPAAAASEQMYGVCLVADAECFTAFAEGLTPRELNTVLNRYFETLFDVVERQGGVITDVVGDGMTAVWSLAGEERELRRRASRAALEIDRAVAAFNRAHGPPGLPTRIGLQAGMVSLGNVGGGGHFAYSVVGDPANTAARIESLNKQLGTRVLAAAGVVEGLEELVVRPLGRFLLVGKREPLAIVEIIGEAGESWNAGLLDGFAEALACAQEGRWPEAAEQFAALLEVAPADGPTRFHLGRCRRFASGATPPADPAVIRLEQK